MTVKWIGPGLILQMIQREGGKTYELADDVAEEMISKGYAVKVDPAPAPDTIAPPPRWRDPKRRGDEE